MTVFHVIKTPQGRRPLEFAGYPQIVTEALPLAAALEAAGRLNEAEGRATDGPVPYHYTLVEALRPA